MQSALDQPFRRTTTWQVQMRQMLTSWASRGNCWDPIIKNRVLGTERKYLRWLLRTVPPEHRDKDELESQVREYACEAAAMYDPTKGASFNTFLTHHLRIRCTNHQQYLWVRSSANANCRKLPIIEIKNSPEQNIGQHSVQDGDNLRELSSPGNAEHSAQLNELLAALPPEERSTVHELLSAGSTSPGKLLRLKKSFRQLAPRHL